MASPKAKWTAVAVGRILRNEFYIGTLVQGKRTTPNHKVKKTVEKPREEWIRVEDSHPPIIGREDFFAVERLLAQDMRVAPEEEAVYLLSGLVFCGNCRQNMVRNSVCRNGKTYVYYMCGNNRANGECSSHRIRGAVLEKSVFLSLKRHIDSIVDMERILANIETLPVYQKGIQKTDALLLKKQEEIERYGRLKASLYESLTDGLINKTEYLELKDVYDAGLKEAQSAEAKLKEEMEGLLGGRSDSAHWIGQFKKYQNLTGLTRHTAVTLIERIDVYEDCRVRIRFRYQDNYERASALIEGMAQHHSLDTAVSGRGAV